MFYAKSIKISRTPCAKMLFKNWNNAGNNRSESRTFGSLIKGGLGLSTKTNGNNPDVALQRHKRFG